MDQRTEPIRQDIDNIRDSMTDKMEQIETKIKTTVEHTTDSIKRSVDVKYQVSQHPWAAFGLAVLAGYTLGSFEGDDRPRYNSNYRGEGQNDLAFRYYTTPEAPRAPESHTSKHTNGGSEHSYRAMGANTSHEPGLIDQLTSQFSDEIAMLKGAAVSSLISLVRDTIKQNMPGLHGELERVRAQSGATTTSGQPYTIPSQAGSSTWQRTPSTVQREATFGSGISTQREVGSNPNYDFIPPAPHAEPSGRP